MALLLHLQNNMISPPTLTINQADEDINNMVDDIDKRKINKIVNHSVGGTANSVKIMMPTYVKGKRSNNGSIIIEKWVGN